MNVFKKVILTIQHKKDPVDYWRKLGCKIGAGTEIYQSASLGGEPYLVSIGNHVRINEGVQFITHDGGVWVLRGLYDDYKDVDMFGQISIGDNVHIGNNVIVMPNVKIGSNCIIGCGAIVTRDIPDNSIAVGIPAHVIETVDEYKDKNIDRFLHTKNLSAEDKKRYLLSESVV